MNKVKGVSAFFMAIIIITNLLGCQPTPEKPAIVGQGTNELESMLSAEPLAPYIYETPNEIEDSIEMNTSTFYVKAAVEITDSQTHPVYTMQNREFSKNEVENICNTLVPDIVSMRDGSRVTKEEIEKDILILKRGIPSYNEDGTVTYVPNEMADRALPEYYELLKNAPEEVFTPVSGAIDYSPPFDNVLLRSGGSKARCSAYANSITVFPVEGGLIQMQSWIIRDGGWEGEGPVHLSPKLTSDAARQIGNDLIAKLNLSNMKLASIEAARMLEGDLGYDTISTGWFLSYTRDEGKGVPFDSSSFSSGLMVFEDDAAYVPYWPQEAVYIYVDETGVRCFNWRYPCKIVEEVNTNVNLLPFSEIYRRSKELIRQGFSWADEPGTEGNEDAYVNRILLTNCIVRKKEDTNIAYWMPTWVFIFQHESTLDNSTAPGCIAVNAIDGSRVELFGQSKEEK